MPDHLKREIIGRDVILLGLPERRQYILASLDTVKQWTGTATGLLASHITETNLGQLHSVNGHMFDECRVDYLRDCLADLIALAK